MSSADKITASIRKESDERIAAINADAEKIYKEMIEAAEKKAQDIRHAGEHKIQLQSDKLLASYKSREELERRNLILKTKRDEIAKAVEHIYKAMLSLDDNKYFDLVLKLAGTLGGGSGTVWFNSRDLKRLPPDIKKRFAQKKLDITVSDKADDSIDSGFILKNGDIEENMSFSSVLAEKRELVEDIIGRELFRD